MLQKLYGPGEAGPEHAYSPAKRNGTKKKVIMGNLDPAEISTSYVEGQNLNVRMQNRRYTRLTNAFSKKFEMLAFSVAITFCYHNFVRIHQTLRMTPAMKAGFADHKWAIEETVDLLPLDLPGKRGPHRKRISDWPATDAPQPPLEDRARPG
jgi:3-methyladenine DNA glycosylase/8-oxoguanine DNA glycosylase